MIKADYLPLWRCKGTPSFKPSIKKKKKELRMGILGYVSFRFLESVLVQGCRYVPEALCSLQEVSFILSAFAKLSRGSGVSQQPPEHVED